MPRRLSAGPATPRPVPRPLSNDERQRRLDALRAAQDRPAHQPPGTAFLPAMRRFPPPEPEIPAGGQPAYPSDKDR